MTITLYANFDGEVLRPEGPILLAPNTRVRVVIETQEDEAPPASSFLRTAQGLNLDGPPDWSSRFSGATR